MAGKVVQDILAITYKVNENAAEITIPCIQAHYRMAQATGQEREWFLCGSDPYTKEGVAVPA